MMDCAVRGLGLNTCLGGGDLAIICECTKEEPTCYDISHIERIKEEESTDDAIQESSGNGGMRLFLALLFMLLVLLAIYYYDKHLE